MERESQDESQSLVHLLLVHKYVEVQSDYRIGQNPIFSPLPLSPLLESLSRNLKPECDTFGGIPDPLSVLTIGELISR
jgi:hypothetical protein